MNLTLLHLGDAFPKMGDSSNKKPARKQSRGSASSDSIEFDGNDMTSSYG